MHKTTLNTILQASRREFLKGTAAASVLGVTPLAGSCPEDGTGALPEAFSGLKPLGSRVHPITAEEYRARLQHAQKVMIERAAKNDALFVAPGISVSYLTGLRLGMAERVLALV